MTKRKLIEVSLPLEAINKQAAREKSIRHGHPSTLHLWWARRPLAAARAVLFSQLVDDPSSFEDGYREEGRSQGLHGDDVQRYVDRRITAERARLHNLLARLVDWDHLDDERLFNEARDEILRSCDGDPPPILDPFAGGGTIPLEAQRLGLEAHASDLNPVAVLINKALIEIPPKFAGRAPVSPDADAKLGDWPGATGLAEDVRRYGAWMRNEAEKRIGHLYPKAQLADGSEAAVIAWIWARTVTCPNPACGIEMPLVRSWRLGTKKGNEALIVPEVVGGRVKFTLQRYRGVALKAAPDGTVERNGAVCIGCGGAADLAYVRAEGKAGRIGARLLCTVASGPRSRLYLDPSEEDEAAAAVRSPEQVPAGSLGDDPRAITAPNYGLSRFEDLFTKRQLVTLTILNDLVGEARAKLVEDAMVAGMPEGDRLASDGVHASAYADAVATYLALGVSRTTDLMNNLVTWSSSRDQARNLFSRQAIPMTWDFVENNPFGKAAGDLGIALATSSEALAKLPARGDARVSQADAGSGLAGGLLSTDPPYYDNIGYADLSDFFYVWLRRSLQGIHPTLFGTMLVPKEEELVANPYRRGGKQAAQKFFEKGFEDVFAGARESASHDYPIAVFYAFKQAEVDHSGTASTGWETLLQGMIGNGWTVTGTWPMRSERTGRMRDIGSNALASSIVLALRPRAEDAPVTDRRGYLDELRDELPEKLRELQQGAIAPVDLAQAAIGPGMAVFSRYARVVEPDGSTLTVREALRLINSVLAESLSEQVGDFDTDTRWCVKWFETHGFEKAIYGEAETLASAYNTTVAGLGRSCAVHARGGEVRLLTTSELPSGYRPERDLHITLWEVAMYLVKALDESGLDDAGRILLGAADRVAPETVKELAYLMYSVAEKRGMTQAAGMFNALVTSWPEVTAAAKARAATPSPVAQQTELDFDDDLRL